MLRVNTSRTAELAGGPASVSASFPYVLTCCGGDTQAFRPTLLASRFVCAYRSPHCLDILAEGTPRRLDTVPTMEVTVGNKHACVHMYHKKCVILTQEGQEKSFNEAGGR